MKKLSIVFILLAVVLSANAQHMSIPFFDAKGGVRLETQELKDGSDTLSSVFHRADDVVWARIVYRVIDMRYKQNYQLYFPSNASDPQYHSLFNVMLKAVADGMEVYQRLGNGIQPDFNTPYDRNQVPYQVNSDETGEDDSDDNKLLNYDSINDVMRFNDYQYSKYVKNQLKFMIQEIVFYDKHYSRLYSKIIGIAPMYAPLAEGAGDENILNSLAASILFWVVYDDFRPYMARQYMIPQSNDTRRVTFEQFFAQKQYTSYLIGDSNMFDRIFSQFAESVYRGSDFYRALTVGSAEPAEEAAEEEPEEGEEENYNDEDEGGEEEAAEETAGDDEETRNRKMRNAIIEKELKREQQRVLDELMNFEQDLWEY